MHRKTPSESIWKYLPIFWVKKHKLNVIMKVVLTTDTSIIFYRHSFFIFSFTYIVYVWLLCVECMCGELWESEVSVRYPGTGATGAWKLLHGYWELSSVLCRTLAAEPVSPWPETSLPRGFPSKVICNLPGKCKTRDSYLNKEMKHASRIPCMYLGKWTSKNVPESLVSNGLFTYTFLVQDTCFLTDQLLPTAGWCSGGEQEPGK